MNIYRFVQEHETAQRQKRESMRQKSPRTPPLAVYAATLLAAGITVTGCDQAVDQKALFAKANQAQSKGDYQTAIIQLKNVLQANPDNAEARYQLGLAYNDSGDMRAAEKEFRKALELHKDPLLVKPKLAKALLQQGEFQKVLIDTEAEGNAALSPELLSVRGMAQLSLGKLGAATASFEQALALSPDLPDALLGQARLAVQKKNLDGAVKLVDRALQKSPMLLEALLLKGDLMRLQNDSAAALAVYQEAVDKYPNNLLARLEMTSVYVNTGRYKDAAKQLEAVRRISAQNPLANYLLALLEFKQQNYAKSREAVQQALKAAPAYLPSQMLAGATEYALGNHAQAEQYLRYVLDKAPDNLYARKLLTVSLLRDRQLSRAIDVLQPALRQAPEDAAILGLAGEVYMQNKEFAKATQFYEKAAKLHPQNAQMRTGLGLSRLASGEAERAVADLEAATDLDATHYQADVVLIMTHLGRNEYAQAEKAIQALEKKQPDNPLTYNLKGAVLVGKNKFVDARMPFEKALQLSPGYFPAAMNLAQLDLRDKNPPAAKKRFMEILRNDPNNLQALMALAKLGNRLGATPQEVLEWLERAKKNNPGATQATVMLAQFYLVAGQAGKAVELAAEARAIAPDNPEVLDALGLAQLAAGEKNAAVTTFGKLVALQPQSATALMRLANAQYANDNGAAAATSLRKALEIKPDLLEAQIALVGLDVRAGRYPEAMQRVKKVQAQAPRVATGIALEGDVRFAERQYSLAAASYEGAYALNQSGQLAVKLHAALTQSGRPSEADTKLLNWLKKHPDDFAVRLYLADAYLKQQKHQLAVEQYERILKKEPQNLLVLNNLAWAYQQVRDPRALQVAERAYKAAPDSAPVIDTYGWMLVEQNKSGQGLELLQRAASLAPDQQEIRFHYASALYRGGKKEQARIELERVLASGIKFPQEAEATALLADIKK